MFGFTKGQTVKNKKTGEVFTLTNLRMRGDAAIIADVASVEMVKDYFDGKMVPKSRATMLLCHLEAA